MSNEAASVILDADFLSSFLKIGRCELIRSLYGVEEAVIPIAVHRELAQTDLLDLLLETPWIRTEQQQLAPEEILQRAAFITLDPGEQECIMLARVLPHSILLMSDNHARRVASLLGLTVVNIPAFLFACKEEQLLNRDQLLDIVQDLKAKDYYEFKADIRNWLLA